VESIVSYVALMRQYQAFGKLSKPKKFWWVTSIALGEIVFERQYCVFEL